MFFPLGLEGHGTRLMLALATTTAAAVVAAAVVAAGAGRRGGRLPAEPSSHQTLVRHGMIAISSGAE
ncbi:hypothetical protein JCM24511_06712 [Saitozyma sp. JCM 24511]|nr:hypothetical protein JCM24511_06712 [Saitozyma sp. JCM 24511]